MGKHTQMDPPERGPKFRASIIVHIPSTSKKLARVESYLRAHRVMPPRQYVAFLLTSAINLPIVQPIATIKRVAQVLARRLGASLSKMHPMDMTVGRGIG
jgi:hypothetical protein